MPLRFRHFLHPASSVRKAIKKFATPEETFREKYAARVPVNFWEWAAVYPDNFFTSHTFLELDPKFLRLAETLHVEKHIGLTVREMGNIYNWVMRTRPVSGDIAEVGVFKGHSAKLISEVKGEKRLYLFDTFEGLPETDPAIDHFKKGDMRGNTLEQVRSYLSAYSGLEFYEGTFPKSAEPLAGSPVRFSFVHLDVDIYPATLDCLNFFYPRMSPGAALISHDYRSFNCRGVKKAFDEFFADKREPIIELWDTQALIIKQ